MLQRLIRKNINTRSIPYIPKIAAPNKNRNLYILRALLKSGFVNTSDDIKHIAIVIIIIGLTIPAFTAASPSISAPSMEIAVPYLDGNLISLSLHILQALLLPQLLMGMEHLHAVS